MAATNHTIKTIGALALGLQLGSLALVHNPAMAHNGVVHGQSEAAPPEPLPEDLPPNTAGPDPIDSSAYIPEDSAETAVESVPTADGLNSLPANTLDSVPLGLGEMLLGLLLIGPWLLITLKHRLYLQRR